MPVVAPVVTGEGPALGSAVVDVMAPVADPSEVEVRAVVGVDALDRVGRIPDRRRGVVADGRERRRSNGWQCL